MAVTTVTVITIADSRVREVLAIASLTKTKLRNIKLIILKL